MMDTSPLLDPVLVESEIELEQGRAQMKQLMHQVTAKNEEVRSLRSKAWRKILATVDLDTMEDLLFISRATWGNGEGNIECEKAINAWVQNMSMNLNVDDLSGNINGKGKDNVPLPQVQIMIQQNITENDMYALEIAVSDLDSRFKKLTHHYWFEICDGNYGEDRVTHILEIKGNASALILQDGKEVCRGTLRDALEYVSKNAYYE